MAMTATPACGEIIEKLKALTPDGLLWSHGIPGCYVISEAERDALLALVDWQPMDAPMPPDRQVLVCWSTGAYDCIGVNEYMEIMGYGEPPARGWRELPAPPSPRPSSSIETAEPRA